MPAVYNALDVCTSASISEGLPNVLGEAMACGIPCVATDVGDSAALVRSTGVVVPPRDPAALAGGWEALLKRIQVDRLQCGDAARDRIIAAFDRRQLVTKTELLIDGLTLQPGDPA
jgi:glycosyltransferase involved in cell wall biosynthesis